MSRLNEGEIAPGIALKQDDSKKVVRQIIIVLEEILMDPHQVTSEISSAFSSYRKLAAWTNTNRDIHPIAENTLRKYLGKLYPGGIKAFNQSREKLLKISNSSLVHLGTKESYKKAREKLKEENQILTNHILQFSAQYLDLLEKMSDMSKTNAFLKDYLNKHNKIYPDASQGLRIIHGNMYNE